MRDIDILVTGGAGFIGGSIVDRLLSKNEVRVRVLARSVGPESRIAVSPENLFVGNVADVSFLENAAKGCDLVIHCANRVEPAVEIENTTTCLGARAAAQVCLSVGARLVHISSCAVYGTPNADIVDEGSIHEARFPGDRYGLAKIEAERALRAFALDNGLPVAIVQPTIVYGPHSGDWTLTPLALLRSSDLLMPEFDRSICNAVYIEDVVTGVLLAAEKCTENCESYLINGEDLCTWSGFLNRYAELGTRGRVIPVSPSVIEQSRLRQYDGASRKSRGSRILQRFAAIAGRIFTGRLTNGPFESTTADANGRKRMAGGELRRTLPPPHFLDAVQQSTRYSIQKAKRDLGFAPQYSLDTGFSLIGEWASTSGLLA